MRGAGDVTTGTIAADNTQAVGGAYQLLVIFNDSGTDDLLVRADADATAEPRARIPANTYRELILNGATNFHYTQAAGAYAFRWEAYYNG
jgi:hypothetical protein